MKKFLPANLKRILGLTLALISGGYTFSQTVNNDGCNAGGFGVNAWLYANETQITAPTPPTGSVDWFRNTTGRNVIDQTNPGTLTTLLQNTFNPLFERRMNGNLSSIADDITQGGIRTYKILIDAVWGRDMFGGTGGIDQTSYSTASKNGEDPAIWDPGPANVLGKNDLLDVAGHMFREVEVNTTTSAVTKNDLWFVGLINRAEPGGDAYMDFEFFVSSVKISGTGNDQQFSSGGPQLGHTAFNFEPDPLNDGKHRIAKIGDIILNMSLTGGGSTVGVQTRIWVSLADRLSITPSTFTWGPSYDGAFNGSPFVYAEILPLQSGLICGYVNRDGQNPSTPPWGSRGTKTNELITNYIDFSVAEMGINLTALGLDHASLSGADPCFFPLNTFIVKSRASSSFTAQLKDFSGPYSWGQPGVEVNIDGNPFLSCDNETVTLKPNPLRSDVTYQWSTLDGNIVSQSTDAEIVVDRPGTYTLAITLPTNCPVQSQGVVVLYDPSKPFFDGPPIYSSTVPCNGNDGTVTVSASGATKPYTFFLYNGTGTLITQFTGNATQSTHTFTDLMPGDYRVDVKGEYACISTTGNFTIPPRTPVVYTPVVTNILCFGDKTGKVELGAVTGKEPLTYAWSTGNTSKDLLNVGAGTYTLNITDGDGCISSQVFTITQPTELTATIDKTDDPGNAGGGSATVDANDGTPAYTYQWSKTGDPAFIFQPSATADNVTNLSYGGYTVKVTDANGCFKILNVFIFEKERCDPANSLIDNDGDGLVGCDDPDCVPPMPASITPGDIFPCIGEAVTYTAAPATGYDSYVWTVPANATIVNDPEFPITGAAIRVIWNTIAGGQICVQGKVYDCLSAPRCIQVNVNDVPIKPGSIIITGGN